MKGIKNRLSISLKDNKYYNPNTFNAVDGLLAYLSVLVITYVVSKIIKYPVNFLKENNIITDFFLMQIILGVLSQGIILLVAIAFLKIKKVSAFSGDGYSFKLNSIDLLMSIMLALAVGLCFYTLHFSFYDDMTGIFGDLGLTISESTIQKSNLIFIMLYVFVLVPISPAIIEELFFRGIVMRGMKEKGLAFSIIGSSVLFATMHGSVGMLILQFLLGLAIAIIVTLTKNHLYGVVMHFSNNLFLSIMLTLPEIAGDITPHLKFVVSAFLTLFGVVFLIVSSYYFFKKYLAKYKVEILNVKKEKSKFDERLTVCYSTEKSCETEYCLKEFDLIDKRVLNNPTAVFLYKDRFLKLNKGCKTYLAYILFAVSLVTSVVMIFI